MIDTLKEVTESVSCALKKVKYKGKVTDPQTFLKITLENGLAGLVFSSCSNDVLPEPYYQRLQKAYYAYIASDTQQIRVVEMINDLLTQQSVNHLFLKGTHLKNLYPESYMRAMGDIDVLVKPDTMGVVTKMFMKHNEIKRVSQSAQHDVYSIYGVTVEVHPTLFKAFDPKYQRLMESPWNYVDDNKIPVFEKEFECVYLLYHLVKHLDASGIGLRSVLDIGVFLKAYTHVIDRNRLNKLLDEVELRPFFNHLVYINKIYFHVEGMDHFIDDSFDPLHDYDDILVFFAYSGIHGVGEGFNPFEARYVSHKRRKKKKIMFYFGVLFPSYSTMKGIYPWLRYAPFLYPFTWALRLIRLALFKRKSSWKKVKQLNLNDSKVESIESVYQKLGL